MSPLVLAAVYLVAMVVTVPVARKLGLGSVLGYLIAGVALGPNVAGVLGGEQQEVLHLAEFGVIMMLFLIGLELRPSVLWNLRGPIFILGTLQVSLTSAGMTVLACAAGFSWKAGLAAGLILSLSSTAIVLQTLQERGVLKTTGGETSFAVLLFQDIAVIPMIAAFPLLGAGGDVLSADSGWIKGIKVLGAVLAVVLSGKYLVRPLFRMVAVARLREMSTALALLLVLAVTLLMNVAGLSPALGAFLAGVILADSEYRHQLETDIEPFKGLLLGVFFISVGAGIDFKQVGADPALTLGALLALLALKWLILIGVGKLGKLPYPDTLLFAFSLAQGGEFAFVLLVFAQREGIFSGAVGQGLTAAVALSMFFAPPMIQGYLRYIQPKFARGDAEEKEPDRIDEHDNPVIVAGFGRFGQMVTRLLKACGFSATVLDFDVEQVEVMRRFGLKAFYGDASQMDLLRSAGAERAKLLVVAIDDRDKSIEIIQSVKQQFPHLKILSRAYDRIHAYELIHLGIEYPYIETAGSALNLGVNALRVLGYPAKQALHAAQVFRRHNDASIQELAKVYHEADEETFVAHARDWIAALERTLRSDIKEVLPEADRAWESPPRSEAQREG